jgi:ring-1,2-phenylacetyl-CoA epoxidase subunit PaaE
MGRPKFHKLKIKEIRRETPECVSVAFDVPEELAKDYAYIPGQYLTLRTEIEGEDIRRSYSICSAKDEPLRVAIKRVVDGKFSTFANTALKEGAELDVMTPMGKFHVPLAPENEKTYVAFAAGSGITPVMSIMKSVLQTEPKSEFVLFFGNRGFDNIIFREEIEALKDTYLGRLSVHHVLSRENLGSHLFNGRIDEEKCNRFSRVFFSPTEVDEYFLCSPGEMIANVTEALKAEGVDPKHIHFELFTSPNGKPGVQKTVSKPREFDPQKESKVTIRLDGDSFDFTLPFGGDTILESALKGGVDLPFACKGGVCCTCRAKLMEGEVDMEKNYALEPEEVEAGFILTCQSHPRSSRVVVDFDIK